MNNTAYNYLSNTKLCVVTYYLILLTDAGKLYQLSCFSRFIFCLSLHIDHHYVSISLRRQGKNLKKQRTSVVKHDPNPTFGKSLVFDVSNSEIELCTLVIKVRHHSDINRDRTFAILCVGHNAQGSEAAHWNDMVELGECVTRWHRMVRIEPADNSGHE